MSVKQLRDSVRRGREGLKLDNDRYGRARVTYTVEMDSDVAIGINDGHVSAQLDNLADHGHIAADVAVEVRCCRARGDLGLHGDLDQGKA